MIKYYFLIDLSFPLYYISSNLIFFILFFYYSVIFSLGIFVFFIFYFYLFYFILSSYALLSILTFITNDSIYLGLSNAICKAAILKTETNDRFKNLKTIMQCAVPCPCPFIKSSLMWMGGSIFGSLKVSNK